MNGKLLMPIARIFARKKFLKPAPKPGGLSLWEFCDRLTLLESCAYCRTQKPHDKKQCDACGAPEYRKLFPEEK